MELGKQFKAARSVLPSSSKGSDSASLQAGSSILFHWTSICFIPPNLSPPRGVIVSLLFSCAQTCARDFFFFPSVESWPWGWETHLTHPSLCQVLIRRQASIDTRDILFRTKWTSILVKKEASVGCVFHLWRYSVGKSSRSSKTQLLSEWRKKKRCPLQLPCVPCLYTQNHVLNFEQLWMVGVWRCRD